MLTTLRKHKVGRDVDGRLMFSTVADRTSRSLSSPWEEARRGVVVETDDSVCKQDSALEEQDHGKHDEEWHRDEDARLLLRSRIVLLHILSWRLWRSWWWRSDRREDG